MFLSRHEAMLSASRTCLLKVHTLGVSIYNYKSCCRIEFHPLSFTAVCAAARGEEYVSPLNFLSAFGEVRGKPFSCQTWTCIIACVVM